MCFKYYIFEYRIQGNISIVCGKDIFSSCHKMQANESLLSVILKCNSNVPGLIRHYGLLIQSSTDKMGHGKMWHFAHCNSN